MGRVVLGMIGLGTVGTGVVRLLEQNRQLILKKVAVRDPGRTRAVQPSCPVTANVAEVIDDPEIEILVEVMGGEEPALEYIERAIERRKHIVTANKEVLAKHGPHLFDLARKKGVAIFFEASVAGGIPLISTMHKGLEANRISSVTGILNGTTNFILCRMEESGESYQMALKEAQELGFAEADPTNDVDGHDVGYKLSILSALAYGRFVRPASIFKEGIRQVTADDISQAAEFGYRIKLVGTTNRANGHLDVRVHPALVPLNHPLAAVSGPNNGILVTGDAVGQIVMVGPGAGQMPTASAVVGDIINLASALQLPDFASYFQPEIEPEWAETSGEGDWQCPFYLRLSVADTAGVIGRIGTIFGAHAISIQSIIQRGVHDTGATIVILTHQVGNAGMGRALEELQNCDFLHKLASCIRIFKPA
ncbi:MAG TPA: homoserine dehydrogenase [Candidatus Obscuribacterales bacterium]